MHSQQNFLDLELRYRAYLQKALGHLAYSLEKSDSLPKKLEENNESQLEGWESLTARFARVVDIFLTKYIKLRVKTQDPIFDGTLRDYLNMAQKMNLIGDVDHWLSLRELYNIQAHDYTEETFWSFVVAVQTESRFVIEELEKVGLCAPQQ